MGITLTLAILFAATTEKLDLPQGLLSSLCYVESSHKVTAIHKDDGNGDSLGVCQIKYETAKLLGYKGTRGALMHPKTNIFWAGKYLKKQLDRYENNIVKAVAAYNAGTYRGTFRGVAKNQKYVNKVLVAWVAQR